jgi:hypothetical protein
MAPASLDKIDRFDRAIKVAGVVVSLLGFAAVVAGLWFTKNQLEANRQTAEAATWSEVSKQWLELDKLFVENPDLRDYVYGRRDITKDDKSYNRIMAQSTYVLDFIDYALNPGGKIADGPITDPFVQLWANYAERVFLNSPAICRELLQNEKEYTPITKRWGEKFCHSP